MPKKSTFTGITSVPNNYFFDVFGQGFNYRISKSSLFGQIQSELGTPGVQSVNDLSGALQLIAGTNMSLTINEVEGTITLNSSTSPSEIQSISFDTTAGVAVDEGELAWNDVAKTLDLGVGGGSVVQIGQEVFIRVVNQSGSTLVDGEMVYITGSQGSRPTVDRVIATSITADMTIGMVTQEIPNNNQGFITNLGIVRNLDTSSFTEGDDLWVSDTVLGGVTNVKPSPPNQAVHVGFVVREHGTLGSVFVRILKEEQLTELHDVSIVDLTDGDMISYDAGSDSWVNGQPEDFDIITTVGGQTVEGDFSQAISTADDVIHHMGNSAGVAEQQLQPDGDLVFQQRTSAGAFENNWAVFNRDAGVRFFYSSSAKFNTESNGVSVTDSNLNVNGVSYSWPSSQGSGSLFNDGSGNLSWSDSTLNPRVIARYRARFTAGGSQSIPAATITSVVFGDEVEDTDSISSDGTVFTAPTGTAYVKVIAQAAWQSNGSGGLRQIFLQQNGGIPEMRPSSRVSSASTSIDERTHFSSSFISAVGGDTFELAAQQTSGSSVDIVEDNNLTWIELVFYG